MVGDIIPESAPDRRRALELLVVSRDGCTQALVRAHGFTTRMLVELIRAGLTSAQAERVVAGGRVVEVARVRITAARSARARAELLTRARGQLLEPVMSGLPPIATE